MVVRSPRAALAVSALLPESLATSLAAFLDEYLGAEQEVPFGGRDAELAALGQWLSDPASGTALVVSEAGQGKSALVTRWAASVAASGVRVVFAPISLRFGTALRGAALRLLVHQLAFATGRKLPEVRDAAALRAECEATLADSPSPDADRIVVVLDGLDEAIDWTPGVDLDLSIASPQIKLLIAARSTPGRDAAGWCQALRLSPSTRTLNLGALGPASVEQLLRGAGLSEVYSTALAAEVQRLSEGDPLLVRLYLEALRATSGAGAAFTASDLPRTPPGLEGWFSRWWEQLSGRLAGYPALAPLADEVFDLLATALGPLPVTVLLALVNADRAIAVRAHELAALLRELRPLLIGDGARVPLVLSHPRLRYFRLEKLSPAQRSELNRRFCALGEAQLRALAAGELPASEAPSYLVQYLGAHLELAASSPDVEGNLAAERSLAALVCQPWQQAWEALEGTFDGFLEDVGRAWQAARRSDTHGTAEAMVLAARCSLVSSSIASLAYHLPPNLAGHLIDHGVWTPAVAVSQLRWPAGGYRSEALISLAPWLDAPLVRRVLAESAQGGHFHDLKDAEGVGALLGRLVELACAEEIPSRIEPFAPAVRAMIVAVAWKQMPRALWPTLARWVIEGAPQVSHCSYAASTAFASLPILEEPERAPVIQRALDRLWDEDFGLDNEHAAMLGAAGRWQHGWDAATRETSHYPRMAMSAHIAPFVPAELSDQAYQQWWTAYQEAAKGHSLLSLSVPRGLRPWMISELMAFLQSRSNDLSIAKPLVLIAYQDRTRLPEALAAVRRLAGSDGALARLSLAPVCDEATAGALASEAYQLIEALMREHGQDELRQRDQYWPRSPDYLPWTYIGSWRDPSVLWVETLRWLPRSQRRALVRALFARFRCVEDQDTVLASAAAVAAHFEAPAREPWTARLLSMMRAEEDHPITLTNLALIASGERRCELAEAAWRGRIPDGQERRCGEALAKAARLVPAEHLPALQVQALQRWQEQHYSQWSSFMSEVRASLTPEAIAFIIDHQPHEWVVQQLLPVMTVEQRQREGGRLLRELWSGFFWQHPSTLRALHRWVAGAGNVIAEVIAAQQAHTKGSLRREGGLARALALSPLLADGHRDLASSLRAELEEPTACCIAALAFARHAEPAHRDLLVDEALAQLQSLGPSHWTGEAQSIAIEWLAPLGYLPQLLACWSHLGKERWLQVASALVEQGYHAELEAWLDPAKLEALGTLLLHRVEPAAWLHRASPAVLTACWGSYWDSVKRARRRDALGGGSDAWGAALVGVLGQAAGQPALERLLGTVVEVGAWFP